MARQYPRNYLIVEDGKVKEVEVKDTIHEIALVLSHQEATGTNKPEEPDFSHLLIKDED